MCIFISVIAFCGKKNAEENSEADYKYSDCILLRDFTGGHHLQHLLGPVIHSVGPCSPPQRPRDLHPRTMDMVAAVSFAGSTSSKADKHTQGH